MKSPPAFRRGVSDPHAGGSLKPLNKTIEATNYIDDSVNTTPFTPGKVSVNATSYVQSLPHGIHLSKVVSLSKRMNRSPNEVTHHAQDLQAAVNSYLWPEFSGLPTLRYRNSYPDQAGLQGALPTGLGPYLALSQSDLPLHFDPQSIDDSRFFPAPILTDITINGISRPYNIFVLGDADIPSLATSDADFFRFNKNYGGTVIFLFVLGRSGRRYITAVRVNGSSQELFSARSQAYEYGVVYQITMCSPSMAGQENSFTRKMYTVLKALFPNVPEPTVYTYLLGINSRSQIVPQYDFIATKMTGQVKAIGRTPAQSEPPSTTPFTSPGPRGQFNWTLSRPPGPPGQQPRLNYE